MEVEIIDDEDMELTIDNTTFFGSGFSIDDESVYNFSNNHNNTKEIYPFIKQIPIKDLPNGFHYIFSLDLHSSSVYPFNFVRFTKFKNKAILTIQSHWQKNCWNHKWLVSFYHNAYLNSIDVKEATTSFKVTEDSEFALLELIFEVNNLDKALPVYLNNKLKVVEEIRDIIEDELNGIGQFKALLKIWNENKNENKNETFWQKIIFENSWVLSQCFSSPILLTGKEVYLGGTSPNLKNAKITDFLYKNSLSNNAVIIEIKKPTTPLIGTRYRGTDKIVYKLSGDLTGSINQVLEYRDTAKMEHMSNSYKLRDGQKFELFNPKILLIAGNLENLDSDKIKCLELFRGELNSIELITFDELFKKIELIIDIYTGKFKKNIELI